ncbi:MAG: DUF5330 domain-containing protein [Rhizobiaceae bacterium]|nr:DUF5330 domain-containing protein [Rhizobiaceae bacterium]
MFRLVAAALAVYVLLPEDVAILATSAETAKTVSAGQALDAANAVIHDIGGFCERNETACSTGKSILLSTKAAIASGVDRIQNDPSTKVDIQSEDASTNSEENTR